MMTSCIDATNGKRLAALLASLKVTGLGPDGDARAWAWELLAC